MNNSYKNKKLNTTELDWNLIQNDLRNKLGKDIYESWLKKISFIEELNNYLVLLLIIKLLIMIYYLIVTTIQSFLI